MDDLLERIRDLRPDDESPDSSVIVRQRESLSFLYSDVPTLAIARRRTARLAGLWRGPSSRLVVGAVVVAISALVPLVLLPIVAHDEPSAAAAAALNHIARRVETVAVPQLQPDQWLMTEQQSESSVEIQPAPDYSPTSKAEATVTATIREWSNTKGTSCVSMTSSALQFASPTNETAWQAAGFLLAPRPVATEGCTGYGGNSFNGLGAGVGVIDVSRLPTDPSTLAGALSTGTTGITGLDQLGSAGKVNGGFERAEVLLIGPKIGQTATFNASLYRALAMMPGIYSLGMVTTHTGQTGLGFAANSPLGQTSIVVDPDSGRLLEARNVFSDNHVLSTVIVNAYEASFSQEFGSLVLTAWLDPVGIPQAVDANSLPPGIGPA